MLLTLEHIFGYLNQPLIFVPREHRGSGEKGGEQSICRNLKIVRTLAAVSKLYMELQVKLMVDRRGDTPLVAVVVQIPMSFIFICW